MKILSIFTKTPRHKRFSYEPRYFDPQEEERKAREERIKKEISFREASTVEEFAESDYRTRIAGSFRTQRKVKQPIADPSANMLRLIILLFLAIWLVAYIQFGKTAMYALFLFVPFYFYLKLRKRA